MNAQISRLCEAIERMRATYDSQPSSTTAKPTVAFPVFRGEECEDVHEFVSNYKRAARLNGLSGVNLALGLPLYLKGHASAWFKTLESRCHSMNYPLRLNTTSPQGLVSGT